MMLQIKALATTKWYHIIKLIIRIIQSINIYVQKRYTFNKGHLHKPKRKSKRMKSIRYPLLFPDYI